MSRPKATLSFDKTKAVRVPLASLRDVIEVARTAEAYDIAAELIRRLDVAKLDADRAQIGPLSTKGSKRLEYLIAVVHVYEEILQMVLTRRDK
jgi:hypothetical protein